MFELPKLPYALDALSPYLTQETLEFHYGKHHKTYVDKLNGLLEGKPKKSLEETILQSEGAIFNNAAQVWNHTFYWNCLTPKKHQPSSSLVKKIEATFGTFDQFKTQFTEKSVNLFGSGWAWLVSNQGKLEITQTQNAGCPLTLNQKPLLTCDVWEHAYYIDYRNARPKYLENFWNIVNWDFVESQI